MERSARSAGQFLSGLRPHHSASQLGMEDDEEDFGEPDFVSRSLSVNFAAGDREKILTASLNNGTLPQQLLSGKLNLTQVTCRHFNLLHVDLPCGSVQ
jgi:hypothetical protein